MIYPKKNPFVKWFFHYYFLLRIKYSFFQINHDVIDIDENSSILMIANHYSWWDAFLLYWLNERLFHKKFHVMTLEDSFYKWPFLKYVGAFSVKKNSRDVINSVNFAASLLASPQNLVLIFPQGKMYSNFTNKLHLENGISKIIEKAGGKVKTIFAVSFIESFKFSQPSAFIYLQETFSGNLDINKAFKQFYLAAKEKQSKIFY